MAKVTGRNVKGNRGSGTGKKSECTSTSKPAKGAPGIKKTGGSGMGGRAGSADPGKGRNGKNMGSSGPKTTGPKYGRSTSSKSY